MFTDKTDVASVRALLKSGNVPDESYLYHVCEIELCDVVQVLCEFDIFRKVVPEETYDEFMAIYASKRSVANVLLKHKCITQETFDSYCYVWAGLGM